MAPDSTISAGHAYYGNTFIYIYVHNAHTRTQCSNGRARLSVGLRQEDTGELLAGQFSTGNLMVKNHALNCVSQVPNRCEAWDIHLLQASIHCMGKLMLSEKHIPN